MEKTQKGLNRREFLTRSALLGAGIGSASMALAHVGAPSREGAAGSTSAQPTLEKRMLGTLEVSALGLGAMSMTSGSYNPPRSKEEMIPVVRGAVDMGITFFDTAEVYGPFTDEEIVGEALAPVRDQVVIASKLGFSLLDTGRGGRDARPESMRKALEGMLGRLKTDHLDLLYLHRVDPEVPIEEVAGTFGEFIKEGKALHYGLSEASPETIRKAHVVHPVTALQTEYSLIQRFPENQILDTCEELGIGFVPWGPVCRGFLTDRFNEFSRFSEGSRLSSVPYFTPEAIQAHMALLDLVREWAWRKGGSPAQLSLAWLLAEKPWIVPIPGTTRLHHLKENIGALNIKFTPEELKEFRQAFSAIELVGVRSPESALTDQ